jgi:hypothetical protein
MMEGLPAHFTPEIRKFHLYYEYRAQLKSYTKLYFDPFRRHNRISFVVQTAPHMAIETTLGQLNFFRWAIQNHILDYVQSHLTEIEEAMTQYQSHRKKRSHSKEKKPIPKDTLKKDVITIKDMKKRTEYSVRFD